ncbi:MULTISPECIES: GNAT family N-acetyltransferase [Mameliella]|uniref:GNAT family N-acetyltransferase n=1 Tax=Mameliella TaxID=1434019 RepID=UPI000B537E5D|nr:MULTISPECIES: GNAT family N-acetyltransferase [Mameliella]MCR9275571.1 GNAT family N-acetyltransferase [Paracoccaceae bacterium]OWV53310.1 GNAT family N-acetyltransferase [Mameliella alba]
MIDTATDRDIPALAEMLFSLNAHHADDVPERFHTEGPQEDLQGFLAERMAEGARALVYRTEGVARAYLLWQVIDQPATALEKARKMAVLDHIYVAPIWRHRGLARRLIARFEAESSALGCTSWMTRVHAFNQASAAMMQGAGARLAVQVFEKPLQAPS